MAQNCGGVGGGLLGNAVRGLAGGSETITECWLGAFWGGGWGQNDVLDFATRDDEMAGAIMYMSACSTLRCAARVGVGCCFGNGLRPGGGCVGLGAPQLRGADGNWGEDEII